MITKSKIIFIILFIIAIVCILGGIIYNFHLKHGDDSIAVFIEMIRLNLGYILAGVGGALLFFLIVFGIAHYNNNSSSTEEELKEEI